ncbi:MAG: hypothetical protein ACOX6D_01370 [Thermoguttaceae bacterium]|jgi:hypothetical protein
MGNDGIDGCQESGEKFAKGAEVAKLFDMDVGYHAHGVIEGTDPYVLIEKYLNHSETTRYQRSQATKLLVTVASIGSAF